MSKELVNAIVEMRGEDALKIAEKLLDSGATPLSILDACREAMDVIGKQFETGEVFIPELILVGLMCTGTPEQVTADVREMIDMFGESGGLLIDASMGIPDESRPENVQALTDAVEKYGVY